jgi:hypothetical protein
MSPKSNAGKKQAKPSLDSGGDADAYPLRTITITAPPKTDPVLEDDMISEAQEKSNSATILERAVALSNQDKMVVIRELIAQLETKQIQSILEFGLREISDRPRKQTAPVEQNTRLLLKKDYSYQDRGLDEPTQYYVYLRRRKPKLDRYIGALFYIPQGCTLSYALDGEGQILFNPPHNIFQLTDSKDPTNVQLVRLLSLQPPPPDYTFAHQPADVPEIYIQLEYLDPQTFQSLMQRAYPFPLCMYENGELDRYRWNVSTIVLPFGSEDSPHLTSEPVNPPIVKVKSAQPLRQVLDLPKTKTTTLYLSDLEGADGLIKRMRLWVAWSKKAMPQSRWEILQENDVYTLINAHFKRPILSFSIKQASITLEDSLPVLMKWFHDLSLAVSQTHNNQRYYTAAQLKLAHNLLIDMSLPQTDPVIVLKKLFDREFYQQSK